MRLFIAIVFVVAVVANNNFVVTVMFVIAIMAGNNFIVAVMLAVAIVGEDSAGRRGNGQEGQGRQQE